MFLRFLHIFFFPFLKVYLLLLFHQEFSTRPSNWKFPEGCRFVLGLNLPVYQQRLEFPVQFHLSYLQSNHVGLLPENCMPANVFERQRHFPCLFYFQDLLQHFDHHYLPFQSGIPKYQHPVHHEPMQVCPPEFQLRRLPFREFLHKNIVPTEDLPDGFCQYMNERYLCEFACYYCLLYNRHRHKADHP